jgi:hypothetical protein
MLLHPDAGVPDMGAERFTSMNVTRNPGATIPDSKPLRTVRPSMVIDDIEGTRPKALPLFQRSNFHDTADIEGARPKVLHAEKRNIPDFHQTRDIEREYGWRDPCSFISCLSFLPLSSSPTTLNSCAAFLFLSPHHHCRLVTSCHDIPHITRRGPSCACLPVART